MEENLGKLIRDMQEASGMSKRELAEILDVSPRQVQRFENGEYLTVTKLLQIAQAFGFPIDVFMDAGAADRPKGLRLYAAFT